MSANLFFDKNRKKNHNKKSKKVAVDTQRSFLLTQRVPFAWERYRINTAVCYTYVLLILLLSAKLCIVWWSVANTLLIMFISDTHFKK